MSDNPSKDSDPDPNNPSPNNQSSDNPTDNPTNPTENPTDTPTNPTDTPTDTPTNPTEINDHSSDFNEHSPNIGDTYEPILVGVSPQKSRRFRWLIGALFLFGFVGFAISIGNDASRSVDVDIVDWSVKNVTPVGFELDVTAEVAVDYSGAKAVNRQVLRGMGGLFRWVRVTPRNVAVSGDVSNNGHYQHLLRPVLPPLDVEIVDGSRTRLSIPIEIAVVFPVPPVELRGLDIHYRVEFNAWIKSWFVRFPTWRVRVAKDLHFSDQNLQVEYEVKSVFLNNTGPIVDIGLDAIVRHSPTLGLDIPSLMWDIYIDGCEGTMVQFGEWKSDPISLAHENVSISVSGAVDTLSRLSEKCPDGFSPLNRLVQKYVNREPVHYLLSGSHKQNKDVPSWLSGIVSSFSCEGSTRLPQVRTEVAVDSLGLVVGSEPRVQAILSANTTLPSAIAFVDFDYKLENLVSGSSNQSIVNITQGVNANMDFSVDIHRPSEVGRLLNALLNGKSLGAHVVNVNASVGIESKWLNTDFDIEAEVPFEGLKYRDAQYGGQHHFANYVNQQFTISPFSIFVLSMEVVSSSENSLGVSARVEAENPNALAIDLGTETVTVGFKNGSDHFGHAAISNMKLPAHGTGFFDVEAVISTESEDERTKLEAFLGEVVSGNGVSVDVYGESMENAHLSEVVKQISVDKVPIPSFAFATDQVHASSEASPFIVECIIHVASSTIELVLYNPVSNVPVQIDVQRAVATNGGVVLGRLLREEVLVVPPGTHKTGKLPVVIDGVGMDLLKRAMSGEVDVDVLAALNVRIGRFDVDLVYKGDSLRSKVRM